MRFVLFAALFLAVTSPHVSSAEGGGILALPSADQYHEEKQFLDTYKALHLGLGETPQSNLIRSTLLRAQLLPNFVGNHFSRASSTSEKQHEYNSDKSTHALVSMLLAEGHIYQSTAEMQSGREAFLSVRQEVLTKDILPSLKSLAEVRAKAIAVRALDRSERKDRWKGSPTVAHLIAEVLLDKEIRRGSVPSPRERQERVLQIEHLLAHSPAGLRLSILALPVRDRNPAKNDGPLPDLGEASSLLRLWTLARAMEISRSLFLEQRWTLLSEILGESIQSVERARVAFANIAGSSLESRLTGALKKIGRSMDWFKAGICIKDAKPTRVMVIRDSRRYPSYWTDPESDIEAYHRGLAFYVKALALDDLLDIRSHEELETEHDSKKVLAFQTRRNEIYSAKLKEACRLFERDREGLLSIPDRKSFLQIARSLDPNGKIPDLIETILHGRWHPELADRTDAFRLGFLASIYTPKANLELEVIRRRVLWSSVVGAAQYVAAYEANTGSKNLEGLDDVSFLVPNSLRLSIHKKPESSGQFTIEIGPSIHRTPWHGTVAMRPAENGKGIAFETRLSLELKNELYLPVFLSSSKGDTTIFSEMAATHQPIVWLEKSLMEHFQKEGISDANTMLMKIMKGRLHHF